MKRKGTRFTLSTTQIILFSFLLMILLGSMLLALPISSSNGRAVPYVDALFTATTATCVTGLTVLPTVSAWSTFGHVVILVLIQVGGLGVITVMSGVMLALQRKMGISDRLLIQDAFNLNTMSGLAEFVRKVILWTLVIEGLGALCYMTVFIPAFGARGIWISIFTSISAFCNAGIDIISESGLLAYAADPVVNTVTCFLVIVGGIGYIVWWDIARVLRLKKKRVRLHFFRRLSLHSKLALFTTAILLICGAAAILLFEFDNPMTMGGRPLSEKIEMSVFQSVTVRTAGFATMSQKSLTNGSVIVSLLLMMIGGSPVGTAGGIKTVTAAVLVMTALATVRGRNSVTVFHRTLTLGVIKKAVAVAGMSLLIAFVSTVLLCAVTDAPALDIVYETVSATATVGLSRDLTPSLDTWGKLIVCATMYLGRVGPISLAIVFSVKQTTENSIQNPTEDISVG